MKMTGSETINASRQTVWRALNDPTVLKLAIPGCESVLQNSPTDLSAKVSVKLGPVKAKFAGAVKLSDIVVPVSYRISGQGQGGLAGFASGGANVKLSVLSERQTLMEYDVDAQVGGKLAMLGSRLIDASAKSLAQQFFTKFAAIAAAMDKDNTDTNAVTKKVRVKKSGKVAEPKSKKGSLRKPKKTAPSKRTKKTKTVGKK